MSLFLPQLILTNHHKNNSFKTILLFIYKINIIYKINNNVKVYFKLYEILTTLFHKNQHTSSAVVLFALDVIAFEVVYLCEVRPVK